MELLDEGVSSFSGIGNIGCWACIKLSNLSAMPARELVKISFCANICATLSSKYSIWSDESIGTSEGIPICAGVDASRKDPIDWKSEVPDPSELYSAVNLEILTKSELRVSMRRESILL